MIVGITLSNLLIYYASILKKLPVKMDDDNNPFDLRNCGSCAAFDDSRTAHIPAHNHLGFCSKFSSLMLRTEEDCKFYLPNTAPLVFPELPKFQIETKVNIQTQLF